MEWLLIEWPEGDKEPSDYWLAQLGDQRVSLRRLIRFARSRWRGKWITKLGGRTWTETITKGGTGWAGIIMSHSSASPSPSCAQNRRARKKTSGATLTTLPQRLEPDFKRG